MIFFLHFIFFFYFNSGPPDPDNLPEDGKLKSAMIPRDELRYHLDLKENKRGRFLKVIIPYSPTFKKGGLYRIWIVCHFVVLSSFRHIFFVCDQYLENTLIDFHQILYMHLY